MQTRKERRKRKWVIINMNYYSRNLPSDMYSWANIKRAMKVKVKKSFIILNVLLMLFYSCYIAPRAQAFAPALFLPAAFAVPVVGQAALVLAVVAAGIYVGTHTKEIDKVLTSFGDITGSYWNSLSASTKQKFADASANLTANNVSQSITMDADMNTAVKNYLRMNVGVSKTTVPDTRIPLPASPYVPSGGFAGSIHTEAYVNQYKALSMVIAGTTYALVPIAYKYDQGANYLYNMDYWWCQQLANGTYSAVASTSSSYGTVGTLTFKMGAQRVQSWVKDPVMGPALQMVYTLPTLGSVLSTAPTAIGHYKKLAESTLVNVTITAAPWVDTTFPDTDAIPNVGELKVPAGVITGTGSQVKVTVAEGVQTTTLVDSFPTTADPGTTDPGAGNPDSNNWANKMKGLVTTKFPFSLPWDLYRLLALLNADAVRPEVHVDKKLGNMPFKFDVTFEYLDSYMPFFRGFIIISFCIMLVMATRRLMGGST